MSGDFASESLLQRLLEQLQTKGWQASQISPKGPQHWQLQALVEGQAQCFELYLDAAGWTLSQQGHCLKVPIRSEPDAEKVTASTVLPTQAAMAGRLLAWGPEVHAGAELPTGSLLYRLEAMKMQLAVTAPVPLRVETLLAAPGQELCQGQDILTLIPLEETP